MSSEGVDEAGWDLEPGDESAPLVEAVGRLVKFCREACGMRVADLADAMGYGEDMIRKIERGRGFLGRSSWSRRTNSSTRVGASSGSWRTCGGLDIPRKCGS